jgi:N-acetylglucosaminyldiphosphoundecaprenol N-acetyl-beta-D-mannosaminyltransferase
MKNLDMSAQVWRDAVAGADQIAAPIEIPAGARTYSDRGGGFESSDISGRSFSRVWITGTPVSIASLPRVLSVLEVWVREKSERYIVCRDVHGVIRARSDSRLHDIHENADIVTPDGMPLVWTAKLLGHTEISRVCGPDLLAAVCGHGVNLGWRHYFYGSAPDVVEKLVRNLKARFPGMKVVGTYSPPFRGLSPEEAELACRKIRSSQADFVWVGLGSPKQEFWMADNVRRCGGAVLVGVGAAFDFHAGTVKRAPNWMRSSGFEWAHRLFREPRRLWRRYLVLAPQFVLYASAEIASVKLAELSSKLDKTLTPILHSRRRGSG